MNRKNKKCAICEQSFYPAKTTQRVCSMKCSIEFANQKAKEKAIKQARKEKKEWKENTMTASQWKQKFQTIFNKYIRKRDELHGCVSCGCDLSKRKFDAGHFYATTYEGLRFNELNVHGQCVKCNRHEHGNLHEYRKGILNRITPDQLKWLDEHRHDELRLTIPEIKKLIDEYKQKIKEHEHRRNNATD